MSMQYWQSGPAEQNPTIMRASDSDRERAADVLKAGFAEGRLSKTEFDDRVQRLQTTTTYAEIQPLLADLPQGPVPMPTPAATPYPPTFGPPAPAVVIHRPPYQGPVPGGPRPIYHAPRPFPFAAPPPQTNGNAVAAMVCGISCFFTYGLTAIPAVILGHRARATIRRTGESGDGMALGGLVMGYLSLALMAVGITLLVLLV
ncbi:DUF1707 and DUF4190 domain-containing protein [Streptomyces sp. DSM 44915]|uniref:DUF1707 and DUF4190 domain-containing protein n=1 Tax=Streptomyces chisholmiae TaxID=3075540 RepID=A0ABU2JPY8_9ACTN|nr:DUF1707 and DUF4190 domain-containing protein [Streptomyces sp. DSM 44915]MDT0267056.1 DUF1707 and DUF4190 domain-containing protein [Streptomyces sp. DSM 44915]